jgi:hypothetical protein
MSHPTDLASRLSMLVFLFTTAIATGLIMSSSTSATGTIWTLVVWGLLVVISRRLATEPPLSFAERRLTFIVQVVLVLGVVFAVLGVIFADFCLIGGCLPQPSKVPAALRRLALMGLVCTSFIVQREIALRRPHDDDSRATWADGDR